jgi:pimeloyl-ACP methyl ester carboxylesterase
MESLLLKNNPIPTFANYVQQGTGRPVILVHGLAASLHDWDDLIPELAVDGYACYALDLLGHGDSPKPETRLYQMDWVLEHFFRWVESLHLAEPPVLIGHSLGGRVALEYARRLPAGTRGLVLVNPFYSHSQLSPFLRNTYRYTNWSRLAGHPMPERLIRLFVDFSSVATGHRLGAFHSLPERIRAQTALDYKRTAPGVYHIPKVVSDLTKDLPEIDVPALVVWGTHDRTLSPASFARVVEALPKGRGEALPAGHVPHQSHAVAFNQLVMKFLKELP